MVVVLTIGCQSLEGHGIGPLKINAKQLPAAVRLRKVHQARDLRLQISSIQPTLVSSMRMRTLGLWLYVAPTRRCEESPCGVEQPSKDRGWPPPNHTKPEKIQPPEE